MAETLLAIVLVTSSPMEGFNMPLAASPQASPRLARPRPNISYDPDQYDNPCRSADTKDGTIDNDGCPLQRHQRAHDEWEYLWQRPLALLETASHSISRSTSHSYPRGVPHPSKIVELVAEAW